MSKTGASVVFRVLLFKLSAIGDIAIAINSLAKTLSSPLEIVWVIDQKYAPYAEHLLKKVVPQVKVEFLCIDSAALLRGNFIQKLRVLCRLIYSLIKLRFMDHNKKIQNTVILHRDPRYKKLVQWTLGSNVIQISGKGSEYDLHKAAWHSCFSRKFASHNNRSQDYRKTVIEKNSIGFLIGGGKNKTNEYREKQWPHNFSFINILIAKQVNITNIYLLGGPEDDTEGYRQFLKTISRQIERHNLEFGDTLKIVDGVGKFSLQETCDVVERCHFLITPDSGIGHIAALLMTHPEQRIISLFGPTNPDVWKPMGFQIDESQLRTLWLKPECSPCYLDDGKFTPCPLTGDAYHQCLNHLDEYAVLKQIGF